MSRAISPSPSPAQLAIRLSALLDRRDTEALAELLLCGAELVTEMCQDDPDYAGEGTQRLAADVLAARDGIPEPRFAEGDLVRILDETDEPTEWVGTVVEQPYVNERGSWEYQVRLQRPPRGVGRQQAYRERELVVV